jgi:hypothetical protein
MGREEAVRYTNVLTGVTVSAPQQPAGDAWVPAKTRKSERDTLARGILKTEAGSKRARPKPELMSVAAATVDHEIKTKE